ncbi:phospholipase [Acidovorax sp. SRB_14]|nr:phospholipase A [Acidovorax sp. SRB_14]NMM81327.1 phospholipase [Acidovorax sp. SRB_14]
MEQRHPRNHPALRAAQAGRRDLMRAPLAAALLWAALPATPALAQAPARDAAWQQCAALQNDQSARLACFDQWAGQQAAPPAASGSATAASANAWAQGGASASTAPTASEVAPPPAPPVALQIVEVPRTTGCRDAQYSEMSRFWELEPGTDCGTFSFRGYRPINASVAAASNVNRQPSSSAPDHTAAAPIDYRNTENRIQLSVRTKIAQGLLTQGDTERKDSLWFGYTQQSYWQLFSPAISRPFRTTDHEPEVVYAYPSDVRLPGGWRLRYSGLGLVHQSNGQSLPLSRSWNRVYLMAGMEQGQRWRVQGRVWHRLAESAANDDNPGISDYIGRGELQAYWNVNRSNTVGVTLRHALKRDGRGSARLEWLQTLGEGFGGGKSNLRLHTQLFSGYGDSLIDYNRRRTVLSVGLSLVDF